MSRRCHSKQVLEPQRPFRRPERVDDGGQVVGHVVGRVPPRAPDLRRRHVDQRRAHPLDERRRHALGAQQEHGHGLEAGRPMPRRHDGGRRPLAQPGRPWPQLEGLIPERRRHPGADGPAVPADRDLPAPVRAFVKPSHKRRIVQDPSFSCRRQTLSREFPPIRARPPTRCEATPMHTIRPLEDRRSGGLERPVGRLPGLLPGRAVG